MSTPLGRYFSLQRGTTYKSSMLGGVGPILLGLGSIARNGGFRDDNLKTYGGHSDPRILLNPGDLYVSLKDVTQSADLLGAVARVPTNIIQGRLTQDTVHLVPTDCHIRTEYIYWLLRTPEYREYCRAHSTGTTNLGLSRDDFLAFPVPELTPLRDAITTSLEQLEEKAELNREISRTLEAMAQAIFRDWFVDFGPVRRKMEGATDPVTIMGGIITDPDRARELARAFPSSLTEQGWPAGWRHESVFDQAEWVNGAAYRDMHFTSREEGLPIVKIAELKAGIGTATRFTNTDLGSRYRIDDGELLFSWSGNPDTSIDTFIWTGGPAWLNQHIFAVRSNGRRRRSFLYAMLKWLSPTFSEVARDKQTTGLGHVTKGDLKRLQVTVPTGDTCEAFDKIIEPLLLRIQLGALESRTLAETRDYLLPRLLSGQVRFGAALGQ